MVESVIAEPSSERLRFQPQRVCPHCGRAPSHPDPEMRTSFQWDPVAHEQVCTRCGCVVGESRLSTRALDGGEQSSKSAAKRISFDKGLGRGNRRKDLMELIKGRVIGDDGDLRRYNDLREILDSGNGMDDLVKPTLQALSNLLKRLGLRSTPKSPDQESPYSDIIGDEAGRVTRLFFRRAREKLESVGLLSDGNGEDSFGLFSVRSDLFAENLLAWLLTKEARLNHDDRRWMTVKGFVWNRKARKVCLECGGELKNSESCEHCGTRRWKWIGEWKHDADRPQLSKDRPELMDLIARHVL